MSDEEHQDKPDTFDKACSARFTLFGKNGRVLNGGSMVLPDYLDWMPIESKSYWFLVRGYGHPETAHVLLHSQGEMQLLKVANPLAHLTLVKLKDNTNGLEALVEKHARNHGLSRTPRNQ